MKISGACEILPDKVRADCLAAFFYQAAIRLMREQKLTDAGHAQWIGQTRDDGQQHDHHDSGADLFQHGTVLIRFRRR